MFITDESWATLDGSDRWMNPGYSMVPTPHGVIRQQQGRRGVMIWAGMIHNQIVGPFHGPDAIKMCAESYVDFSKKNFVPLYKKQPLSLKRKITFVPDNAPAHAAINTVEVFRKFGFM